MGIISNIKKFASDITIKTAVHLAGRKFQKRVAKKKQSITNIENSIADCDILIATAVDDAEVNTLRAKRTAHVFEFNRLTAE